MPKEGGPLINIDFAGLAKPATTLVEKVSDAVGGIAKPWQIVRVAKAKSQAGIIRTTGAVEAGSIMERAKNRLMHEEVQKQENIESITAKAIPNLTHQAKPEDIEKDWLSYFFDRARLVSDDEMQSLWSNILSGEANQPGKFSRRTIDVVSILSKADAQLLTNLCSLVWRLDLYYPLILDRDDEIFSARGLNFDALTHLASLGLITYASTTGYVTDPQLKHSGYSYFGKEVHVEYPTDNFEMEIGCTIFTMVGAELLELCGAKPYDEFYDYVIKKWNSQGYTLSFPTS